MALSSVGDRYSVSIGLSNGGTQASSGNSPEPAGKDLVVYNDPSIASFMLTYAVNTLPVGTARIVSSPGDSIAPASGTYGTLSFIGIDSYTSDITVPIYILHADRRTLSTNAVAVDISFEVGIPGTQSIMENTAVEGTCIDAFTKLVRVAGLEVNDFISANIADGAIGDSMIWRFVEGSFTDHMNTVVNHCMITGDVAYWTYDEYTGKIRLGTYNSAKKSTTTRFMMYTNDAVQATHNAYRLIPNTDTKVWLYSGYLPEDVAGTTRDSRSPNLYIDSTSRDGQKEIGNCASECWSTILNTHGAKKAYTEKNKYGSQKIVKPFPMNTHKMYAVAPYIRSYMVGEYSKRVTVNIINHPGPQIGSCVHFYAEATNKREGEFLPDAEYTARYIVAEKVIRKASTTEVGMLGRTVDTSSSNMVTELHLISNAGYDGDNGSEYMAVTKLAGTIATELGKKGSQ